MSWFSSSPEKEMSSTTLDMLATHRKQKSEIYGVKITTKRLIEDINIILKDIKNIKLTIKNITENPKSTISDYNTQLSKLIRILNDTYNRTYKDEVLQVFAIHMRDLANKLSEITASIRSNTFTKTSDIAEQISKNFNSAILQDIETTLTKNRNAQQEFLDKIVFDIAQMSRPA